jgi:Arc/MetJ family transcription regulator
MSTKRRLSASIDEDLLAGAEEAVRNGSASSVSAWVNAAFRRQLEHERRMLAMAEFLVEFEAEFGEITDADIAAASKQASSIAVVVRSPLKAKSVAKRRSA